MILKSIHLLDGGDIFPNTCLNQIYNLTSDISLLCLNTQQTNQSIKILENLQDVDKSVIFLSHIPLVATK